MGESQAPPACAAMNQALLAPGQKLMVQTAHQWLPIACCYSREGRLKPSNLTRAAFDTGMMVAAGDPILFHWTTFNYNINEMTFKQKSVTNALLKSCSPIQHLTQNTGSFSWIDGGSVHWQHWKNGQFWWHREFANGPPCQHQLPILVLLDSIGCPRNGFEGSPSVGQKPRVKHIHIIELRDVYILFAEYVDLIWWGMLVKVPHSTTLEKLSINFHATKLPGFLEL